MCSAPDLLHWLQEEEKSNDGELWKLSQKIWWQPEIRFLEFKAHDNLAHFLESKGFKLQRNFVLPTAFKAEIDLGGNSSGPTVAFLCEYDALPEIGHGCGHNLIAEIGVASALAVRSAASTKQGLGDITGKLVVLGTPAEEGGGGKIKLAKGGAFTDVDVVLMAHPVEGTKHSAPTFITSLEVNVVFTGRASHAAARPWEGLNALDAAVACYVNVALLKQQLKPGWKINGIFTRGGDAFNVIPHETAMAFLIRTPESRDSEELLQKFQNCVQAAADSTGCQAQCKVDWDAYYKHAIQNKALRDRYRAHITDLGAEFSEEKLLMVSTDFSNLSQLIPGIHPMFGINTHHFPHQAGFTGVAGSREAQVPTLITAAALAATCIDIMQEPQLLKKVKELHARTLQELNAVDLPCQ